MHSKQLIYIAVLVVLSPLIIVGALGTGSVFLDFSDIFAVLSGRGDATHAMIVFELRLPRIAAAFLTGALLSLAGALMQVLLRNPLADPYVLGISGGAGSAVLLGGTLGLVGYWQGILAFAGALLSTLLVFGLAHGKGQWNATRLLLTGVVVAAGWGAVITFLLAVSAEQTLRGNLFWLMGDLSSAQFPIMPGILLVAGLFVCAIFSRDLNVMAKGEMIAQSLGVSVRSLRYVIYFMASIFTAAAVAVAGSVGFVGLVVPHFVRLLIGSDHRYLLPASVLTGGCLLTVADTLARTVLAPQQLPVGVVTAFIGVPLFLYLLQKGHRSA